MDQRAITVYGIPSIVLMENAGRNSAEEILAVCCHKKIHRATIICGKGNNGGDGFVIARYLQKAHLTVTIFLVAQPDQIQGDAKTNLNICLNSGIPVTEVKSAEDIEHAEGAIIVDALLGTGIHGEVHGLYAAVIEKIMSYKNTTVFSVDIPSGISGNDALPAGPAVHADFTLTMAAVKQSQLFYPAKEYVGNLKIMDIGFPPDPGKAEDNKLYAVGGHDIHLPDRDKQTHKHSAGKVLVVGASVGYTGAVCLAAIGASLSGAGLVVTAVPSSLNKIFEKKLTEQMSLPIPDADRGFLGKEAVSAIKDRLAWTDVILIGPGMGRDAESLLACGQIIDLALKLNKKLVIDADALFWLSLNPAYLKKLNKDTVLTPHYGEFLRIFPDKKELIQKRPWQALHASLQQTDATINLKGPVSIAGNKNIGSFINTSGNPGLAKGGSGDLLGGIIAGFMACGLEPCKAAYMANYIHGAGADSAAEVFGPTSFSMDDLARMIKKMLAKTAKADSKGITC